MEVVAGVLAIVVVMLAVALWRLSKHLLVVTDEQATGVCALRRENERKKAVIDDLEQAAAAVEALFGAMERCAVTAGLTEFGGALGEVVELLGDLRDDRARNSRNGTLAPELAGRFRDLAMRYSVEPSWYALHAEAAVRIGTAALVRLWTELVRREAARRLSPVATADERGALQAVSEALVQMRGIASDALGRGHSSVIGPGQFSDPVRALAAICDLADACHNLPGWVADRSLPHMGPLYAETRTRLADVGRRCFGGLSPFEEFRPSTAVTGRAVA